jgi:hypothetical protein
MLSLKLLNLATIAASATSTRSYGGKILRIRAGSLSALSNLSSERTRMENRCTGYQMFGASTSETAGQPTKTTPKKPT